VGRLFNSATPDKIVYTIGSGFTGWPWGTIAAVIRPASDAGANVYPTICELNAASDDAISFFIDGDHAAQHSLYNGTGGGVSNSGTSTVSANGWQIVGVSKATGSATPRFHRFPWTTGVWNHSNGSAALPDPALTVTDVRVGSDHFNGANTSFSGDIAAVMFAPKWAATDSEFERLASGNWDRYVDIGGPGFLAEFPNGRDQIQLGSRSQSRDPIKATTLTGTARSARSDPPGFEFSRFTRRR
jgi:hypothetical protein